MNVARRPNLLYNVYTRFSPPVKSWMPHYFALFAMVTPALEVWLSLALFSLFTQIHHVNGADGTFVVGDLSQYTTNGVRTSH